MSKHTPRPWKVDIDEGANGVFVIDEAGVAGVLAYCGKADRPIAHHNAHLMAAAPELLEALKDALDGRGDFTAERIAGWRAAVAKAEGK